MKVVSSKNCKKRWLNLIEKYKDELSIENSAKMREMVQKNDNSWELFCLKLNLLKQEYQVKGE